MGSFKGEARRNFKQGPDKPELVWRFSSQHFNLLSAPSYPCCFYWSKGIICSPSGPGGGATGAALEKRGGVLLGRGGYELSARLQTCQPSCKHRHRLSQAAAAAATATASRDFNELASVLQPPYLPPAAPPNPSLPLSAPILAAPKQRGEGERNYLLCACWKWKAFTF